MTSSNLELVIEAEPEIQSHDIAVGTDLSRFNILHREQPIHRHLMLEASAGTGKTFAIENLVVRLLIEAAEGIEPAILSRILVVTFTKAAMRDLKVRIRSSLDRVLSALKSFQAEAENVEAVPDFLLTFLEKGPEDIMQAKRRVEAALFTFDQAQIFTIHGFCWRMLQTFAIEGGLSLHASSSEDKALPKTKLLQVIADFFRTGLVPEKYSPQQIGRVLQMFNGQVDKLQLELFQMVSKGIDVASYPSYAESLEQFVLTMQELNTRGHFTSENILADFMLHVPAYKGICNRQKQVQPAILKSITQFALLFDQKDWTSDNYEMLIRDGLVLLEKLDPSQLSAKGKPPAPEKLHYPDLLSILEKVLAPIVHQGRDQHIIFARMVGDCQKMLRHYQAQEELLGFNDLLQQMRHALLSPEFAVQVRKSFDAAIVDEFQDTDPVQWDIFRELFISADWPGHLYLVGDPKQSIYAFRQADIYTYLSAVRTLEDDARATLDTNYRSQPPLVDALNILFESAQALFPLPYQGGLLPYRQVRAGKNERKQFVDQGACLQFWLAKPAENKKGTASQEEAAYFFPAMVKELIRLHAEDGIAFKQCAILVADRYQAEKIIAFLQEAGIPSINQRGYSLAESSAVHTMLELLQGILHYRKDSSLRIALGGVLIGMSHAEILALNGSKNYERTLHQCEQLRCVLLTEGFASFYSLLMCSCWHEDDKNVLQRLLEQHSNIEFYREWQDIAELLMQEQVQKNLTAEGLIAFLNEFDELALNEDDRIKKSIDHSQDGVNILTSHVSKGLEFDIVFALGLIKQSPQKEKLMPVQHADHRYLEAIVDKESVGYRKYCEELDAEKMRQLYVALTRAKHRLYIPVIVGEVGDEVKIGTASPIELLLVRLGHNAHPNEYLDYDELYRRIHSYDVNTLYQFVNECQADISIVTLQESSEKINYDLPEDVPDLLPPPKLLLQEALLSIHSFTSLVRNKIKSESEEGHGTVSSPPHDFNVPVKNTHTLPAGSETGIVVHAIFEHLPFDIVKKVKEPAELLPWVFPLVQATPFESWVDVLMDIVFNTLKIPLGDGTLPFCLADLDPKKIVREAEFLFPSAPALQFGDAFASSGYIKGVIDLFFEHEGKYYLLDWKSNWIGPSANDYQYESLASAMQEHDYGLQAKIYVEALQRYLKLFDERPFEEMFGGIFYLFVRGIGPSTGIIQVDF